MIGGIARKFFEGKKCVFCGSYFLYRLNENKVKCGHCKRYYSLQKLRRNVSVLYYFYLEVSARKTARELKLNYKTVQSRFMDFRRSVAEQCQKEARQLQGELELDETYFGGKRKGKRGRGAYNKAIAFGILERKGKVHTVIVDNVKAETLLQEIENKTLKGSVFYTDGFRSYASLEQYGKHNVIDHDKELVNGRNHINGIEGFWSFAKERFHKYHGINKENYPLYIKEMEFRFNHRNENVFNLLFDVCIKNP
jgi:transposase